ncbi:uracil-DNA glycosylase [Flavobacterium sp. JP2137]|uniref:uracil-DNA glycosylase n=1 Tax=Flavobacterium sp. JP2137 TaxID=3414510 RepID=UPI003D2FFA71
MNIQLPAAWAPFFSAQQQQPYYENLMSFVAEAYRLHRCFPPQEQIWAAFDAVAPAAVKVVIIGQDPYHGWGQANGLCFSVNDGLRFPPSLVNIFKEIEQDIGEPLPISGNLERWATQGVLMLNAILTVEEGKAGSHQKQGWELFTTAAIQYLSDNHRDIVFLLWGNYAIKKGKNIDLTKHRVLTAGHPSPLSANRGYWFGNRHFSQVNQWLIQQGKPPIIW